MNIGRESYVGEFGQMIADEDQRLFGRYLYRSSDQLNIEFDFLVPGVAKSMTYQRDTNLISGQLQAYNTEAAPTFDFQIVDTIPAGVKLTWSDIEYTSGDNNGGFNFPHLESYNAVIKPDGSTTHTWTFKSDITNNERLSQRISSYSRILIPFELESDNDWFGYRGTSFPNSVYAYTYLRINDAKNFSSGSTSAPIPFDLDAYGLSIAKTISVDDRATWQRENTIEDNQNFDYRLSMYPTQKEITNIVIYDNLPFVGDIFNEGNNVSRGSEFDVNLVNNVFDINVTNGSEINVNQAKIYFSTMTTKAAGINNGSNPNWILSTNWANSISEVVSFSIVFEPTQSLKVNELLTIDFKVTRDSNAEIKEAQAANTFHTEYLDDTGANKSSESNAVLVKTQLSVPPEINKNVNDLEHLNLTNRNDEFTWKISTAFGTTPSAWDSVVITDQIESVLEIKDVKVYNLAGDDITNTLTGTLDVNKTTNLITLTMDKVDNSFAYLTGEVYRIEVLSKIKDTVTDKELSPFILKGGIPNQASLNFGDGSSIIRSEIPTVTPPPVDPGIDKTVNDLVHLDLVNRNDAFTWKISTAFGQNARTWDNVVITDQIESVLEIRDVKVYNLAGNDITNTLTGTLDVNKTTNLITLTMDKVDNSFAYLTGEVYRIEVISKIKDTVTDKELAPFIIKGGIPNQAKLWFGNGTENLLSGIPTVMPPAGNVPPKYSPKTGDSETQLFYLFLLLLCSSSLVIMGRKKKYIVK